MKSCIGLYSSTLFHTRAATDWRRDGQIYFSLFDSLSAKRG